MGWYQIRILWEFPNLFYLKLVWSRRGCHNRRFPDPLLASFHNFGCGKFGSILNLSKCWLNLPWELNSIKNSRNFSTLNNDDTKQRSIIFLLNHVVKTGKCQTYSIYKRKNMSIFSQNWVFLRFLRCRINPHGLRPKMDRNRKGGEGLRIIGSLLIDDSQTSPPNPPSLHFGQNEIIADSESTPSETSIKVISDK